MLPPCFHDKQKHTYGKLTLLINKVTLPKLSTVRIEPHFFGNTSKQSQTYKGSEGLRFQYQIVTNLWHFYAYLADCRVISLTATSFNQIFFGEIPIQLFVNSQVLNKYNKNIDFLFSNNSYLLNRSQKVDLYDQSNKLAGSLVVQIFLEFDEQIHRILQSAQLINYEEILVVEQISPIPSSCDLQNLTLQIQEKPNKLNGVSFDNSKFIAKQQNTDRIGSYNYLNSKREQISSIHSVDQRQNDQKMVEDDIDRLIAEMQSKPYDSSRYLENSNATATLKNQNFNYSNFSELVGKSTSQEKKYSQQKTSKEKYPPKCPNNSKCISSKDNYSPLKSSLKPIFSYTANNPLDSQRTNYLMNMSQDKLRQTQRVSSKDHSYQSNQKRIGLIKVKIYELMIQRQQNQLSLILKLYINDSPDEFYTVNGLKQGEIISFNSNFKIDQKIEVNSLRFDLIDSFDMKTIFASGSFEMNRLYCQNPTKGIFMVNMMSPQFERASSGTKTIRLAEQNLVRVTPNVKTLRIELEYEQPIQIVQIYLCLSEFKNAGKICRYKIPMTKQTIEFKIVELANNKHVNIFPHNRSSSNRASDKIIIELWSQKQLIGISEVSLKAVNNTNQQSIQSSLEPVYLFQEMKEVNSINGSKTMAKFHLKLCYGTISQIQNILNQQTRKQTRQQLSKTPVSVEQMLGVYVKQNKGKREMQIQVDSEEIPDKKQIEGNISKKMSMNLEQQNQLPDEDQGLEFQNDSLMNSNQVQNQFLSRTMEEKYLNKETLPIFVSKQKSIDKYCQKTQKNFSVTTNKGKNVLKSLTKQFQQYIKKNLDDFGDEQKFMELKDRCKDHLLYNFIELSTLSNIFRQMGVCEQKTKILFEDIIPTSNNMANINVVYDLVYGMILEGHIKEKYIDDSQIGKYALSVLYKQSQELEGIYDFVFDNEVEFQEARKFFEKINFKITMRQFDQIEVFLKKTIETLKMSYQEIKKSIIQRFVVKSNLQMQKQKYQNQIISNLYKAQWDEDDDFFISNINQTQTNQSPSMTVLNSQMYLHKDIDENTSNRKTRQNASIENKTTQNFMIKKQNYQNMPIYSEADPLVNFCQKIPNFKIIIQGLQSCLQTTECHLNMNFSFPKLRVVYKSGNVENQKLIQRLQGKNIYEVEMFLQNLEYYLDGSIQLINGVSVIAQCNFSTIIDVRSVYTLKSIKQSQFCGLVYIKFSKN